MAKRDIFNELMAGVAAIKSRREGKITLRTYEVEIALANLADDYPEWLLSRKGAVDADLEPWILSLNALCRD